VSKYNLANCLLNQGFKAEASRLFRASAEIYRAANGDDDEDTQDALYWAEECEK